MNIKAILLFLFIPVRDTLVAQEPFNNLTFKAVDSFALTVKFENNYIKLANDLTAPYFDDVDKVRSIFKWVTENVAYDYRFINKGREIKKPDCEGQFDCIEIMRSWENDQIKRMLRTKKAIDEGYAKIFQKLCDINMIQNEIVPGYARTRPYQIGNRLNVNHTWNAVFIDTAWYFLDVTWAAGFCPEDDETGKLTRFVKKFNNYYWLMPFDRMSRTHYPKNEVWAEGHNLSKEDFFNKPHYYSTEILENISNDFPSTGILQAKKGDTIHFHFTYKKNIRQIQINSNIYRNPSLWTTIQVKKKTRIVRDTWAEKKQVYVPFRKQGNDYEFDYRVNDNSLYYLELAFDYKPAVRYRVKVGN